MKKVYVLYHSDCYDGFGSAWAANTGMIGANVDVSLIPMNYNSKFDIDAFEPDSLIFMLDFSMSATILERLAKDKTVIVLDHHATAKENLAKFTAPLEAFLPNGWRSLNKLIDLGDQLPYNVFVLFDMERSGAMITWEFFIPELTPPQLIHYIQDRDLWRFELPHSKAINAFIRSSPLTLKAFDALDIKLSNNSDREIAVTIGEVLLTAEDKAVSKVAHTSKLSLYDDKKIAWCISPIYQSEIGNRLLELHPECDFAMIISINAKHNGMGFSLRSKDFDVARWASDMFEGGGHPKAAGFSLDLPVALEMIGALSLPIL